MIEHPAAPFTPSEIAWALSQLDMRAKEESAIDAGLLTEQAVRRRRCMRAQAAGISRARHRELIRHVEATEPERLYEDTP